MSEQSLTTSDNSDLAASEIEAEVSWTVSNRPPEVILSFQGLHEPQALWATLTEIGWVVPGMPPRPANAIEWIPDPVAGTDFTVVAWRAEDFKLDEGNWTVDEDKVGERTLDALLDHKATIIGSSDQITDHARTYELRKVHRDLAADNPIDVPVAAPPIDVPVAAPPVEAPVAEAAPAAQSGAAPAAQSVAAPAAQSSNQFGLGTIPNPAAQFQAIADGASKELAETAEATVPESGSNARFLLLLDFPREHDPLPEPGTWIGVSGRGRTETGWSELSIRQDEPIPGHQDMATHVANGAGAWYADSDEELSETAPAGQRIVRLFVPDMTIKDAKIRRMNKLLGNDIESHQLRSLIGGEATAVLVSAFVGGNNFEMLMSNLALRMPKAVVRRRA